MKKGKVVIFFLTLLQRNILFYPFQNSALKHLCCFGKAHKCRKLGVCFTVVTLALFLMSMLSGVYAQKWLGFDAPELLIAQSVSAPSLPASSIPAPASVSAPSVPVQSVPVQAEERSIYVGDLIEIRITANEFTVDELKDKFKEFEIVSLEEEKDGVHIILRTFEVGEKTVQLGSKELKIIIRSTLEKIDRNEIFEGDLTPIKSGFSVSLKYVFFALLFIFLATGVVVLIQYIKKRKITSLSPYEFFINQVSKLLLNDDKFFVKLTWCLKTYLETSYNLKIRGKTSAEIIQEIKDVYELKANLPEINSWLLESDYYKFAGAVASDDKKYELVEYLKKLVRNIENAKEGVV